MSETRCRIANAINRISKYILDTVRSLISFEISNYLSLYDQLGNYDFNSGYCMKRYSSLIISNKPDLKSFSIFRIENIPETIDKKNYICYSNILLWEKGIQDILWQKKSFINMARFYAVESLSGFPANPFILTLSLFPLPSWRIPSNISVWRPNYQVPL